MKTRKYSQSITQGVYLTKETQRQLEFLSHELGENKSKVIARGITMLYNDTVKRLDK